MLEHVLEAASQIFTIYSLSAIILGTIIGMVLGAIPGLTGTMGIILILPLTYYMNPIYMLPALVGMYKGSVYAGSIPAILFNTPGSPASAATALDGYALFKKGQGGKALDMARVASFFGDVFSDSVLVLVATPLAGIALRFGPIELSALILFSMTTIAVVVTGSMVKG